MVRTPTPGFRFLVAVFHTHLLNRHSDEYSGTCLNVQLHVLLGVIHISQHISSCEILLGEFRSPISEFYSGNFESLLSLNQDL